MTTQAACAGALSGDSGGWHSIDWASCHREVRRLQTRIVKATREGRWGKVKALQWLLTHSFSGKALAVRRVTENQGKKTPGVDKVVWDSPEKKLYAMDDMKRRGYRPSPLKRVHIPKANGKLRPLGIPTMKDRAMQALYLLGLLPVSETVADGCSYGFRPERSVADAIERCFTALGRRDAAEWVLEADIKGCFDHISHDWLLGNVPMDRHVLKMWLKCGFMENATWSATEAGTPQGGIISPTLANLALDGLEALLLKSFFRTERAGKMINPKVHLIRYADDFVITGSSKALLVEEVKPLVERFLAERGLTLSTEKTHVTHIDDGFDFLGQNVRKYHGKLLIKPAAANYGACVDKIRTIIKSHKTAKQSTLIKKLNPVIQGWANFHRHVVAKRLFQSLDRDIWRALWRWAKRRHPNKNHTWIRERYFHVIGHRTWVFASEREERTGSERRWIELRQASDIKIKRHTVIRTDANPFDPLWETYFEDRIGAKMKDNLAGRKRLLYLWLEQDRKCPVCDELLTKESGWWSCPCNSGHADTVRLMTPHYA
ncbi:Group II intron-encoded protein LtrA [Burkholderia multivorans]|uniref:group II intron reverse transcriptase/maturase n=1 Tax=Burkholderia multivorans TaxID=87883 RepID=UPI002855FC2F|nr:group II intron reverse transcriptase/maturase [Burkholderia multivorans]MDR8763307.1 Group II intron-encoded protein LtrA [Burkholderia multivorans]MDR8774922.1 Group II intron-encoded protein LtrA [Burkholderia multivorans]MDR8865131.1 Group II intron-encoded protein LtrA [Burkholderia multivorans]